MIFPFVLAVIGIMLMFKDSVTLTTQTVIPKDILTWCPHTRFCDIEPAQPSRNLSLTEIPCCQACSCSPDCGMSRNCCTDELDQYKLDETLGTICKSLSTRTNHYYHIVDKCPNREDYCREVRQSSLFFPVYSRLSGRIYYNTQCANCHNKTDIVEFIPSLVCRSLNSGHFSSEIFNALSGQENECFLYFAVPENIDISSEKCEGPLIEQCANNESPSHLKKMCLDFNATYFGSFQSYKNVYCYLCSMIDLPKLGTWTDTRVICPKDDPSRTFRDSTLVVLLDHDSLEKYELSISEQDQHAFPCASHENGWEAKRCRQIYCPVGQVRVKGRCLLLGQRWYVTNLHVYIKLAPVNNHQITLKSLHDASLDSLETQYQRHLIQLGLRGWKQEFYFNVNFKKLTIRYFIAVMILRNDLVQSSSILYDIDQLLKTHCTLKFSDKSVVFKPYFNTYSKYLRYRNETIFNGTYQAFTSHWSVIPKEENIIYTKSLRSVFYQFMYHTMFITKLFYCMQVDLADDEYEIITEELYIKKSGRSLGSNEYQIVQSYGSFSGVARVCLSDFNSKAGSAKPIEPGVTVITSLLSLLYLSLRTA